MGLRYGLTLQPIETLKQYLYGFFNLRFMRE